MPAAPPQKGGVFVGSQPPLFSGLAVPFCLARKEIYWVWVTVLAEQGAFPQRQSVSPGWLRTDVWSEPQATSPGLAAPGAPLVPEALGRDAPGCLTAQGSGENHRTTECSGLEGASVGHPVQPPAEAGSPTAGCTGPRPGGS